MKGSAITAVGVGPLAIAVQAGGESGWTGLGNREGTAAEPRKPGCKLPENSACNPRRGLLPSASFAGG